MQRADHIIFLGESYESRLMVQIIAWMEENMSESLDVEFVATRFQISSATLQRIFKKYQQMSFLQYLNEIRMRRALDMLNEGKMVKQIMYEIGYKYRSSFITAFKKKYGFTPSHFIR